jgi:predicted Zn-dependent peptidase
MELEFAVKDYQAKLHSKYTFIWSSFLLYYSIGVYVGSGSRNETLQTTGTSYLLQKMAIRGTQSRSKTDLAEDIENMGARYSAQSEREFTRYGLQCFSNDS